MFLLSSHDLKTELLPSSLWNFHFQRKVFFRNNFAQSSSSLFLLKPGQRRTFLCISLFMCQGKILYLIIVTNTSDTRSIIDDIFNLYIARRYDKYCRGNINFK